MPRNNVVRAGFAIIAFTAIALVLRTIVAYNSGMWADEGSFFNVIASPSWGGMIEFLKQHESHPPLFYVVMRAWGTATGWGDRELMMLPILFGTLIVPVTYLVGATLFSPRAALFSSGVAAISAPLIEHSAQLRPYGLLALLAVISTGCLAQVLTRPARFHSIAYVVSSALMIYTHHWGWLILGGQCCAAALTVSQRSREEKSRLLLQTVALVVVVVLCYVPWVPALIYQLRHAGHGSLPIEGVDGFAGYLLFSVHRILETLLLGRLADRRTVAVAALLFTTLSLVLATRVMRARPGAASPEGNPTDRDDAGFSIRLLLYTAGFALLAALILSPLNNLLQSRGIATVMPLILLAAGYEIDKVLFGRPKLPEAQLVSVIVAFGVVASTLEIPPLLTTRRSNVREISQTVRSRMQPNDMLVLAPEWFAASFDHYFPPSIEQIDFPYEGRSAMIDFSDVWEGRQNSTALPRLVARLSATRQAGRRVWLVLDRRYLKVFTADEMAKAYRRRQPAALTVRDVRTIHSTLTALYGPAPQVFRTTGAPPIHDEFVAYLFSPPPNPILRR